MQPRATLDAWRFSIADVDDGGAWLGLLSLLLGSVFTLGLFLGIAHFQGRSPEQPPPELDDLRMAVMPVQPPPMPPVNTTELLPDFTPIAGFALSRSESPVKIAVSPPELATLLPEDLSKAPPANVHFGLTMNYRPTMSFLNDTQHVFQRSEVDQPPKVLSRSTPSVSSQVRDNANALRVVLVVVINADGSVGEVRLTKSSDNAQFDELMVEAIKEWVFSPAIKNGRKVRCLIEQAITVKWSEGSKFEVQ